MRNEKDCKHETRCPDVTRNIQTKQRKQDTKKTKKTDFVNNH
jgi:hypothetical protein